MKDLQNIVHLLKQRYSLESDRATCRHKHAAGKAFLDMLGVFAEFEANLRKERQAEGIAKAKDAGKYKGKPTAQAKTDQVRKSLASGMTK